MNILVLNVGSSSLKFQLVDTDGEKIAASSDRRLARGQIERIGGEAIVTLSAEGHPTSKGSASLRDHAAAVEHVIQWLTSGASGVPITRVAEIEVSGIAWSTGASDSRTRRSSTRRCGAKWRI
ncbi:MAG TPA: hypothetical protein VIP11_01710 [Gemmatimonadaceae bacterium]